MSFTDTQRRWIREPALVTEGYSLEMSTTDIGALHEAAPKLPNETAISVTFLPGETLEARLAAACEVRALGFEPMPHFSARRIGSEAELKTMVERMAAEAGVTRCFAIAGDPPTPEGPYAETSHLIKTGLFEANGIRTIGIAGHPQGHPNMTREQCFGVLEQKCAMIRERGMRPLIVTQFGFDPPAFMQWLIELRERGVDAPVRIGVPGPTSVKALLRFAARCGVEASAAVLKKYGISIGKLLSVAGPDKMIDEFATGLSRDHYPVRLHFYPFGGLVRTVEWIEDYGESH